MNRLLSLCSLLLLGLTQYCQAGVDFYSNSSNAVTFDFGPASGQSPWVPLAGWRVIPNQTASNNVKLDGNEATTTTNIIYMSNSTAGFGGTLVGLPSGGAGYTYNDSTNQWTNDGGSTTITSYYEPSIWDGGNSASNDYFLWAAESSSGVAAIGWAKFYYSPSSVASDPTQTFVIDSWAGINNPSGTDTIVIGDTTLNNTGVPEPTGVAVFGLLALSGAVVRRRR